MRVQYACYSKYYFEIIPDQDWRHEKKKYFQNHYGTHLGQRALKTTVPRKRKYTRLEREHALFSPTEKSMSSSVTSGPAGVIYTDLSMLKWDQEKTERRAEAVGRSYLLFYTLMGTSLGHPSHHKTGTAGRASTSILIFSRHLLCLFYPRYTQHLRSLQTLVWSNAHNPAFSTSSSYQKLREREGRMCCVLFWLPHPLKITLKVYVFVAVNPKKWRKLGTSFSGLTSLVHVMLFLVEMAFRLYPLIGSSPKSTLSCLVNKS